MYVCMYLCIYIYICIYIYVYIYNYNAFCMWYICIMYVCDFHLGSFWVPSLGYSTVQKTTSGGVPFLACVYLRCPISRCQIWLLTNQNSHIAKKIKYPLVIWQFTMEIHQFLPAIHQNFQGHLYHSYVRNDQRWPTSTSPSIMNLLMNISMISLESLQRCCHKDRPTKFPCDSSCPGPFEHREVRSTSATDLCGKFCWISLVNSELFPVSTPNFCWSKAKIFCWNTWFVLFC